jgi:hypothetical protein
MNRRFVAFNATQSSVQAWISTIDKSSFFARRGLFPAMAKWVMPH